MHDKALVVLEVFHIPVNPLGRALVTHPEHRHRAGVLAGFAEDSEVNEA